MKISDGRKLALHVYQLLLVRRDEIFEYATIIEAHHPDYLLESDLLETYPYENSGALTAADLASIATLIFNTTEV